MATLEKIRNKSVLLVVVIFAALLAFILGDALTNGRSLFGDQTTVVKVDGDKIDINEYQNKIAEISAQNENNPRKMDEQVLSQVTINTLVRDRLLNNAIENLGIEASNKQIEYYTLENPINQNLVQLMVQMHQSGMLALPKQIEDNIKQLIEAGDDASVQKANQDYAQALMSLIPNAYDVIFNPKNSGFTEEQVAPFRNWWLALESETAEIIKTNTYMTLLAESVKANKLDTKAMYDEENNTSKVMMAFKPFGTLDEKTYPVSEEELKAEYEKNKNLYKVTEPGKSVDFIAVTVVASDEDKKASSKLAEEAVNELKAGDKLSKKLTNSGIDLKKERYAVAEISNPAIKRFVESAPQDSVAVVSSTPSGFTVVKVGAKELVDSVEVCNYDVASYQLVPSEKTVSEARAKLEKFVATNNTAEKFAENAVKEGYANITTINVSESTPAIVRSSNPYMGTTYYPASRQVVKWALKDAETGNVSPVFESENSDSPVFYVAAVKCEYEDFVPYTEKSVKEALEASVRASKAGDEMVKKYASKGSIEATAQAMGVEPRTIEALRINSANEVAGDMELLGNIIGAKTGKVYVVKGENGVYAYCVESNNNAELQYQEDKYQRNYMGKFSPYNEQMLQMLLRGGKKIENRIFDFVSE